MRFLSPSTGLTLAAVFIAGAFPSQVHAQTMYACVGPQGNLRLVSGPASCRPSEISTSWNQQGPAGSSGPQGPPGPPGPQGDAGEQGQAGADGTSLNVVDSAAIPTVL